MQAKCDDMLTNRSFKQAELSFIINQLIFSFDIAQRARVSEEHLLQLEKIEGRLKFSLKVSS